MSEATPCRHCGLAVPSGRGDDFCCEGCARVFELLQAGGLGRFYELRGEAGVPPPEMRGGGRAWLDRLLETEPHRPATPRRLALDVQGIHCAACVWLLEELFRRRDGAILIRINPGRGRAELAWWPERLDLATYLAEVERFGYRFGPPSKRAPQRSNRLLVRLGVSLAAAANVMLFSIAFYAGLSPRDGALYPLFGNLSLALTALAVTVGGWEFFRGALAGLRARVAHLDLPIAVGILLAFAGSVWAHVEHGPEAAYFDTVSAFVALMLLGRFLQERLLERNRDALLAGETVESLVVRVRREGALAPVPVGEVRAGDELSIVAGEVVPVAAVLLGRPAELALDWITGESELRPFAPGDEVPAGAFNVSGSPLRLAATQDFADSRLPALLGPAQTRGAGAAGGWWTRLGTIYVLAVLALAAAALSLWLPRGLEEALRVTVAVLVVTCPCAIGLGVPLAHEMTAAALRRRGVFVREGTFFDRALRVRKVLYDKTGTLTRDRLELSVEALAAVRALPGDERRVLAGMAARSNHPASRAVAAALGPPEGEPEGLDTLVEVPGRGLEWHDGERVWRLGRPADEERSTAAFSLDDRTLAVLPLREVIRPDVRSELARLGERGMEVWLLSGDTPARVAAVADAVGLPPERCLGGLSPEGKAEQVRRLDASDTLMVGDGINDAPAFAAAFATATPAVDRPALPARADLFFLGDGIAAVRRSLAGAGILRRVVVANLAFALAYNAAVLALSFAGLVTPLGAAVLMPASSLTVVLHTVWRLSGRRLAWTS